jgi:hypothetical protein
LSPFPLCPAPFRLEQVNRELASLPASSWEGEGGQPRFSASVLSKASREGFYLGLGLSWLDKAPAGPQPGVEAHGEDQVTAHGARLMAGEDAEAAPLPDDQSASPAATPAKKRGGAKKEG